MPNPLATQKTQKMPIPAKVWKPLIQRCNEITAGLTLYSIKSYHELGQAVSECLAAHEGEAYGKAIVPNLSSATGIHERTLWYAVQFAKGEIRQKILNLGSVSSGSEIEEKDDAERKLSYFNWTKIRMLMAFDTDEKIGRDEADQGVTGRQILARLLPRIISGELRTDDHLRDAIRDEKKLFHCYRMTKADRFQHENYDDDAIISRACQQFKKKDASFFFHSIDFWMKDVDLEHTENPAATLEAIRGVKAKLEDQEAFLSKRVGEINA